MASLDRKVGLGVCVAAGLVFGATTLWMSVPPREDPAASPAGIGRRTEAPIEIRIEHHDAFAACLRTDQACRDDQHWRIRVDGAQTDTPDALRAALGSAVKRSLVVRGSDSAQWGYVQRIMQISAHWGITRIDWEILERDKGRALLNAPLWQITDPLDREPVILEEIRVFMKWDPRSSTTLRKCGNRGQVESDEELMNIVLQMVRDYGKAGKTNFPILLDAMPDVPWKDVVHVVELCRKENLESIEIAPPFYAKRKVGAAAQR